MGNSFIQDRHIALDCTRARRVRPEPPAAARAQTGCLRLLPLRRRVLRAAGIVVLALAVFALLPGILNAQVSPGPLSRAHQFLSGPTRCTSCHELGKGAASFKCLDCHMEISLRLKRQRGLHPSLVGTQRPDQACARCHSEHNGEDFQLIQWDPAPGKFNHSPTGYVLEGKHAQLECAKCHNPSRILEVERQSIQMKDLKRTFLGLPRDCAKCHEDVHRGQLGADCQRCHTPESWKTTQFDHGRTRFPLTGAHVRTACQKCHAPAAGEQRIVQFKVATFDSCAACHRDPHRGAFPQRCESCHNTSAWKQVALAGNFDHAKTVFPLLGKHAAVACNECHKTSDFKRPVAHTKCGDCHADAHNGQFLKRADGGDCAACHTGEGFKPAKFGVSEHASSAYPLEGKHITVACEKCHVPAGKATRYRMPFARCTDCHSDPHKGQFAGAPHQNRCESCHTVQGYRPSKFTIARHQETRFPLSGAHLPVPCSECHRAASPSLPVAYRIEDRSCTGCHVDPHRGQFRELMARPNAAGNPSGCEACHTNKSWRDVSRFDHSATRFQLSGAHRAVACVDCHRPPNLETSMRNVNFNAAPSRCEDCHADIHGGQFAAEGKQPTCAECHNTAKWKPSLFDHDKRTTFALKGGHEGVRCAACHANVRVVQGREVLFYKPTPRQCAACHADR